MEDLKHIRYIACAMTAWTLHMRTSCNVRTIQWPLRHRNSVEHPRKRNWTTTPRRRGQPVEKADDDRPTNSPRTVGKDRFYGPRRAVRNSEQSADIFYRFLGQRRQKVIPRDTMTGISEANDWGRTTERMLLALWLLSDKTKELSLELHHPAQVSQRKLPP